MLPIAMTVLLSLALEAQDVERSASGGQIQGRIVDMSDAGIEAFVRVIRTDTESAVVRIQADETGRFQTQTLSAGSYRVTAWQQGFRRRDLAGIVVRNGDTTDLGRIRLDLSGCDAPGVNCDDFGLEAGGNTVSRKIVVRNGGLRMKPMCGAAIDEGRVYCPEPPSPRTSKKVDMQFTKDGTDLYLSAANGAAMSIPNSANTDCSDAKYTERRIRVNDLGMGIDLCVRSKLAAVSHVFFLDDIYSKVPELNLWYVTRKY